MINLFKKQKMDQTSLEENLDELYRYRMNLTNKLNLIDMEIDKLEKEKVKLCDHNFICEREEGMYGERFWKCNKCGLHRGF